MKRIMSGTLTLSSTISMEKSLPSPRELLHVRMLLLLVTRARMVHLQDRERGVNSVRFNMSPLSTITVTLGLDWFIMWFINQLVLSTT